MNVVYQYQEHLYIASYYCIPYDRICIMDKFKWHYDYVNLAVDSGFYFQNKKSQQFLENSLGMLDVERVISDRDIAAVEKCIPAVAAWDSQQLHILDPNFVKVFRMGQLAIEYLLFCKKYLDNTVSLLKTQIQHILKEKETICLENDQLKGDVVQIKTKLKELKSTVQYTAFPENMEVFECTECLKMFSSEEFLSRHKKRRHSGAQVDSNYQVETDKLQLEIKELKERLNNTEKMLHPPECNTQKADEQVNSAGSAVKVLELQQKFEMLKMNVECDLKLLQTQKHEKGQCDSRLEMLVQKLESVPELLQNFSGSCECKNALGVTKMDMATQTLPHCDRAQEDLGFSPVHFERALDRTSKMQMENLEEVLQQKVLGSIEKLEEQYQTIYNELGEIKDRVTTDRQMTHVLSDPSPNIGKILPVKIASPVRRPVSRFTAQKLTPNHLRHSDKSPPKHGEEDKIGPRQSPDPEIRLLSHRTAQNDPKDLNYRSPPKHTDKTHSVSFKKKHKRSRFSKKPISKEIVNIKPSNTSTLGQRSLSSLQKATTDKDLLRGLQAEVIELVDIRLQELGVSPEWIGLPTRSYHRVLEIVCHQASLTKKNFPNYTLAREQILNELQQQLMNVRVANNSARPKNVYAKETDSSGTEEQLEANSGTKKQEITVLFHNEKEDSISSEHVVENLMKLNFDNTAKIQDTNEEKGDDERPQTSGVLKHTPEGPGIKKKVLFNLNSEPPLKTDKIGEDNGNSTSATSSILDDSKAGKTSNTKDRGKHDLSDWDISDISGI